MRFSRAIVAAAGGAVALVTACAALVGVGDVPNPDAGGEAGSGASSGSGSTSGSRSGSGSSASSTSSSGAGSSSSSSSSSLNSSSSSIPSSSSGTSGDSGTTAIATVQAPDCTGCTFPPMPGPAAPDTLTAPPVCPSSAPPIKIVYPPDNVLVPPNMGIISVQWKPNGAPYVRFEVDVESGGSTDWRIVTSCSAAYQTTDFQVTSTPATGGCDLPVQGASWSFLSAANRGGSPVSITVRGTTDGSCASVSSNAIRLSFASEDLNGTYYYWKSTAASAGVGGQIWTRPFGASQAPESDVTSAVSLGASTLAGACNGCHVLSRDGSRMIVLSDDVDSDDEYSDVGGSVLDMTTTPATAIPGGVSSAFTGGQPPGFSAFDPTATYYLTSNGLPLTSAGAPGPGITTSAGYASAIPGNALSLWTGDGALVGPVALGPAGARPTMPDWSIDGQNVVFVQPQAVAHWDATEGPGFTGPRDDDDHVFGGSIYTVPYFGNRAFGTPTVVVQSSGENNYYPSYSPDGTFILFNRAPLDMSAGSLTGCTTGAAPQCPNDSFSNPAARLMLVAGAGVGPIDLANANGSPATSPIPLSNSYPRWAPFVQSYKGYSLLWLTFSSTRDYGLRILNHKTGMYQCYPADAPQTPGAARLTSFPPQCQQPQLWMAPVVFSAATTPLDVSGVAFWIPYQDPTTHNHSAQWTEQVTQVGSN